MSAAPKNLAVDAITLDAIASDPAKAASLTPEERAGLLMRTASVLAALSAGALTTPSAPIPEGPRLLKIREVAARLRCSRGHVYELVKRGELPAVHVGNARVVRADAIDDYLRQHERR